MPQLLDHLGRPITVTKQALSQEVARPGLTGVRQAWSAETAIAGLTPDRLESILRQANQGDMDALLILAEEMEERDPHYGAVLSTRKLAALGLEKRITWARGKEEDPRAAEILEACQELIQESCFDDLLEGLLDALGKPYAVTETLWNTTANQWRPAQYIWRDPRWFKYDRETGLELRLKSSGHPDGEALPPAKFAVHLFGRKSGLPARGGLARLVAFSFVCKLYGVKDWLAYAEIFGIPLRLGKYDASARPEDVETLKRAVFGLGSDAAAVIPQAMTIDFPSAGGSGGPELFHTLVTWIDNQVSKAVLGQTGTTDMQKGGGYAQATVLNEVRTDLLKADARALSATVTRDILTPFVRFNWGAEAPVPALELIVEEPEDVQALGEVLERLVPLGLKVDQAEIRKKLKLSEPASDAQLLTPPASATTAPPAAPEPAPLERRRPALARASADLARRQDDQAALDDLVDASVGGWSRDFGAEVTPVLDLVRNATSFEEIQLGLARLASDLAAPAAARGLASAMFAASAIARED